MSLDRGVQTFRDVRQYTRDHRTTELADGLYHTVVESPPEDAIRHFHYGFIHNPNITPTIVRCRMILSDGTIMEFQKATPVVLQGVALPDQPLSIVLYPGDTIECKNVIAPTFPTQMYAAWTDER